MVYLNRIYTKTGDSGETSLGDGARVPKTSARIAAYGAVDELNAVLGIAVSHGLESSVAVGITEIQNDLFDVGADLCVPESDGTPEYPPLRVTAAQVEKLEAWIDRANDSLSPLTSFVLPGGSIAAAHLHQGRTVCRRAEIQVLHLMEAERVNPQVVIYLNRLSDLLFVLSRQANDHGKNDVLWVPGGQRHAGGAT
ncbi:MAG: cob(I)yrinic acid a,c-diamide adenosyltransferase [Planctomycetaceae bacterium]